MKTKREATKVATAKLSSVNRNEHESGRKPLLESTGQVITITQGEFALLQPSPFARTIVSSHVETLKKCFEITGIIKPVVIMKKGNQYMILDGNHRAAAAKKLGLPICCQVVKCEEENIVAAMIALQEQDMMG